MSVGARVALSVPDGRWDSDPEMLEEIRRINVESPCVSEEPDRASRRY